MLMHSDLINAMCCAREANRICLSSLPLMLFHYIGQNHRIFNSLNICSEPGRSRAGGGWVSYESIEILWPWDTWPTSAHLSIPCCHHTSPPCISVPQVLQVRKETTLRDS